MTSNISSQSPSTLLTWLSAIETSTATDWTSTASDQLESPLTQTSSSLRRKRQRSVGTTTPVRRKRRTTTSLDGFRTLIHEEVGLEERKRERARTRIAREPLHELSSASLSMNMAANWDVCLCLPSGNESH